MGHPRIVIRQTSGGTYGSGNEATYNTNPSDGKGAGFYIGSNRIGPCEVGDVSVNVVGSGGANTQVVAIVSSVDLNLNDKLTSPSNNTEYYFFIKNSKSSGNISITFPHQGHTASFNVGAGNIGEASCFYLNTSNETAAINGWVTRFSEDTW